MIDKTEARERAYNKVIANLEDVKRRVIRKQQEMDGIFPVKVNEELLEITKRGLQRELETWSYLMEAIELYDFVKKVYKKLAQ